MDTVDFLAVADLLDHRQRLVDADGEATPADSSWNRKPLLDAAVVMPMTSPLESTSAPPESPGCTSACTWIRLLSVSALEPSASVAVIWRLSAVTVPEAAVGSPPRPSALPSTTIGIVDDDVVGLADRDGVEIGDTFDLDERDVVGDVVADHLRGVALTVATDLDADGLGVLDHVVVGEHLAGARDHHAGAGALSGTSVQRGRDVDETGLHLAGDTRDVGAVVRGVDRGRVGRVVGGVPFWAVVLESFEKSDPPRLALPSNAPPTSTIAMTATTASARRQWAGPCGRRRRRRVRAYGG